MHEETGAHAQRLFHGVGGHHSENGVVRSLIRYERPDSRSVRGRYDVLLHPVVRDPGWCSLFGHRKNILRSCRRYAKSPFHRRGRGRHRHDPPAARGRRNAAINFWSFVGSSFCSAPPSLRQHLVSRRVWQVLIPIQCGEIPRQGAQALFLRPQRIQQQGLRRLTQHRIVKRRVDCQPRSLHRGSPAARVAARRCPSA